MKSGDWNHVRSSICISFNYPLLHIFSYPFMVGGNLIPVATASPRSIFPGSTLDRTSSTRPFCRLTEGHTQTPQLHLIPCHAYCPSFARHLLFGHSRRPVSKPCSSSERIQERGVRKWCVHTLCGTAGFMKGVRLAIGPVSDCFIGAGTLGWWLIRYGVVASVRLRDIMLVHGSNYETHAYQIHVGNLTGTFYISVQSLYLHCFSLLAPVHPRTGYYRGPCQQQALILPLSDITTFGILAANQYLEGIPSLCKDEAAP